MKANPGNCHLLLSTKCLEAVSIDRMQITSRYDKPNNENFQNKMENAQYRACLAITGRIQETSRERPYDDLSLH